MSRFVWMVALMGSASIMACYNPSFRNCAIECDSPNACPSGLTCDMSARMCTSGASCSGVIDAPMNDGDGSGSGSGSNCYPFTPTNFDPCSIPAAAGPLDVQSTDQYPINTATCTLYMFNSQRVCLLHYTSVTIDGTVTINGAIPVIIVSDTDITVTGTISSPPTNMNLTSCGTPVPTDGGVQAAGGGGGGYGGTGGNGGTGAGTPTTMGAAAFGMQSLDPLALGCPGGRGANTSSSAIGGRGGYGGGALELSAQGQLQVSGKIGMNGEGGGGGQFVLGSPGSTGAGGGGGGTGGSILLEASTVTITATGNVCAIGGGGGQGADFGPLNSGAPGATAQFCQQAPGGGPSGTAGTGGNGGAIASATSGMDHDSGHGGGGGGGAEGRIRVHSIMPASISPSAPFAPLPYVQ